MPLKIWAAICVLTLASCSAERVELPPEDLTPPKCDWCTSTYMEVYHYGYLPHLRRNEEREEE